MIQLQFSTDPSWEAGLIRAYCHSWCSHVDFVMPDKTLLGSTSDGGVKIRPANYSNFSKTLTITLTTTDEQTQQFSNFCQRQIGKPYDWTALFAMITGGHTWDKGSAWYCSELMAAGLQHAGILKRRLALRSDRIDPGDLLFVLSAMYDLPLTHDECRGKFEGRHKV
jgi:hypothetical protein